MHYKHKRSRTRPKHSGGWDKWRLFKKSGVGAMDSAQPAFVGHPPQ